MREFATTRNDQFEMIRLPLLSAECLELLRTDPSFQFRIADILQPLGRNAHVIRAMNIITQFHFGEAELRRAIRSCLKDIRPGGVLILGRSPSEKSHDVRATIYREDRGDLHPIRKLNGGYELDHLVHQEMAQLRQGVLARETSAEPGG